MYDEQLAILIEERCTLLGYGECPSSNTKTTIGMIAWNNGCTEAGTNCCFVECICDQCDTNIFHFWSWWPGIDDLDELYDVIRNDLPKAENHKGRKF